MAEIIKETTTTQRDNASPDIKATEATGFQTIEYLVYFLFGVLEILLLFRLLFKIAGAGVGSTFVSFIYGLTGVFILPFEGIFRRGVAQGIETTSVLEPSTLVAIVVYAVIAWGIVKLIRIFSGAKQTS